MVCNIKAATPITTCCMPAASVISARKKSSSPSVLPKSLPFKKWSKKTYGHGTRRAAHRDFDGRRSLHVFTSHDPKGLVGARTDADRACGSQSHQDQLLRHVESADRRRVGTPFCYIEYGDH